MTLDPNLTCCFSGHRTMPEIDNIETFGEKLTDILRDYYAEGVRHFICGGAVGFDMVAATAVVNLKRRLPDICLTIAIPCRNHDAKWSMADKERFARILERADVVRYISAAYHPGCMHERNRRLVVDNSRYLICYLGRDSGGTYYTYSYAKKKELSILNIYPFSYRGSHGLLSKGEL